MLHFLITVYTTLFIFVQSTSAADITVKSFTCEEGLAIYATNFYIGCNRKKTCTIGKTAYCFATLKYTGIESLYAYVSLKTSSKGSTLPEFGYRGKKVNLCAHATSNNGRCYQDGVYFFNAAVVPPSRGDYDWFLTGLDLFAELDIYADQEESTLLGQCSAHFAVTVTHESTEMIGHPSRSTVEAIAIGVIWVCFLVFVVAYLKIEHDRRKCGQVEDEKILRGFHQMIDRKREKALAARSKYMSDETQRDSIVQSFS